MKVALTFPGCHKRGGVERVMYECARYLSSRGHSVSVFANEWEREDTNGIDFRYVSMARHPYFLRGWSYYQRSTAALAKAKFNVLNTHGCICPTGGVHWVHSVQRAWLEQSRKFRPPLSLSRLRQRINPLHPILLKLEAKHFKERKYVKLIALTNDVRSDLHRFYNVPPDDVVVIPNGYSPVEFNPAVRLSRREAMRSKLGFTEDHIVLLFVAHELERKGYATILSALQILNLSRLRLLVVGRNRRSEVLREAAKFGVEQQVLACGATGDVAGYHAASDVFVLPTQYEAFCLAILEALGSGLPVVTTTVPGARDAIRPGENGFVINDPKDGEELAESLKSLLDDDFRARLSANAAGSVQGYQWEVVLKRYEEVLENACN